MSESCRCADCGLLAAQDRESRELVEVELGFRVKWSSPGRDRQWKRWEDFPCCSAGVLNFQQATNGNDSSVAITKEIAAPRKCEEFFKWRIGFSPKEHVEMRNTELLRQEIEQRRQDDERRAEERRQADERRAEERRAEDQRQAETRLANDRAWQVEQERVITRGAIQATSDHFGCPWFSGLSCGGCRSQAARGNKFRRNVYQAIAITVFAAVLAAIFAVLAEPWKAKPDPQPPQIIVNLPPDIPKK